VPAVKRSRIWVVGFGTVGQWLLRALHEHAERLATRYGVGISVVGLANARDGFIHDPAGLDLPAVLKLAAAGAPITQLPGVQHWRHAIDGLRATDADVLVEVTASPADDNGEPGLSHLREALGRGIPVVTSNKWPIAWHGVELAGLARRRGVPLRAESTVMSGTPLLSALVDGLAGAVPVGLRGVVNATANAILTDMAAGKSYADALADAQEAGLAERDPSADVDGPDSVAKVMILSALVFGRQLRRDQVACRGISDIDPALVEQTRTSSSRLRHLATLGFSEPDGAGQVTARVEPTLLAGGDPLAAVDGTANAVVCRLNPVGDITIIGPGAGPQLAGQGVFSDLIAVTRLRAES
jgi:homoserine dehydrogenase